MAKVVNLNKFRKAAARKKRAETAEANRRRHGRTAAERARDKAEKLKSERTLDGARLSTDEPTAPEE